MLTLSRRLDTEEPFSDRAKGAWDSIQENARSVPTDFTEELERNYRS